MEIQGEIVHGINKKDREVFHSDQEHTKILHPNLMMQKFCFVVKMWNYNVKKKFTDRIEITQILRSLVTYSQNTWNNHLLEAIFSDIQGPHNNFINTITAIFYSIQGPTGHGILLKSTQYSNFQIFSFNQYFHVNIIGKER